MTSRWICAVAGCLTSTATLGYSVATEAPRTLPEAADATAAAAAAVYNKFCMLNDFNKTNCLECLDDDGCVGSQQARDGHERVF
jgi:hypothetical protein